METDPFREPLFIDRDEVERLTSLDFETLKRLRKAGELVEGVHYCKLGFRSIRYCRPLMIDWCHNRHDPAAHQRAIEHYMSQLPSWKALEANRKKRPTEAEV